MISQSLALAYDYCRQVTLAHYENFPVGSFLIPKSLRPHVYAIYAFSRIADDFADEPEFSEKRLDYLKAWQKNVDTLLTTVPTHPIFIALRHTLETHQLPLRLFSDLLSAFTLDLTKQRYSDDDELLRYCRYSANPVGRLILLLFNYRDDTLMRYSDSICTALQLANHWQDLSIDSRNNRIYVPETRLKRHGVTAEDLLARRQTAATTALVKELVTWTETLFAQGEPLMRALRGRLRWEIRLTVAGGMQILNKIKKMDYAVLGTRPRLTKKDWLALLIGGLCR